MPRLIALTLWSSAAAAYSRSASPHDYGAPGSHSVDALVRGASRLYAPPA
jgi:hypothetical protein